MLTTDDESIAKKLRALRIHGTVAKYIHQWPGKNSRLDALQAAVLDVKLRYLDDWSAGAKEMPRFIASTWRDRASFCLKSRLSDAAYL